MPIAKVELDLRVLRNRRRKLDVLAPGTTSEITLADGSNRRDSALWEDTLFYLGKPEEWTVKAISSILNIDNKLLRFGGGHDFYDQATFVDLLREGGLPTAAAIPLGFLAAIINPLDPLNVAAFTKLTKAGTVGKAVREARGLSIIGRELTQTGASQLVRKAGVSQISQTQRFKDLLKFRSDRMKFLKAGKSTKKIDKTIREARGGLANTRIINEEFAKLQRAGLSVDDITQAATPFEQARRGQRHLLSLSLGSNPIIRAVRSIAAGGKRSFVPTKLSPLLKHSVSTVGFKGKGAGAVVELPFLIGGAIRDKGVPLLNKFGATIPITVAGRELKRILKRAALAEGGDVEQTIREGLRKIAEAEKGGLTRDDFLQILDTIEGADETVLRLAKKMLTETPEDIFTIPTKVSKSALGIEGISLTRRQKEALRPSVVEAPEAVVTVEKLGASTTSLSNSSGHAVVHDGEHIVVRLQGIQGGTKAQLSRKLDIPGMPLWTVVDTKKGERFLVARWTGGVLDANQQKWSRLHIQNLEVTAALLAKKGIGLRDLTAADVLVGAAGEIQIVNPNSLVVFKKADRNFENILQMSMDSLQRLTENVGDLPRSGFAILSSPALARKTKRLHSFDDPSIQSDLILKPDKGENFRLTSELVDLSNNTQYIKELKHMSPEDLDNFLAANGIDIELQKLADTQTGEPIRFAVDALGNVEIVEGQRRLAAAHLLGFDMVPVQQVDYTGEIAQLLRDERVNTGAYRKVAQVLDELPSSADDLPRGVQDSVAQGVKILGPDGLETISPEALNVIADHTFLDRFKAWFTRVSDVDALNISSARASALVTNQENILESALRQFFKTAQHDDQAALLLADLVATSGQPGRFFKGFAQVTNVDIQYKALSSKDQLLLAERFTELKVVADDLLDDLATQGVFSKTRRTSQGANLFSADSGKTVIFEETEGLLQFVNKTLDEAALRKEAETFVRMHIDEVLLDTTLVLQSAEGTVRRASVRELLGEAIPTSRSVQPAKSRFFISEAEVKRLRTAGAAFNPTSETLRKMIGDNAGRLVKSPNQAFFFTRSGDLFISQGIDDVETLLGQVFGEATKSAQEFGIITKDTIYLNNVFGSNFTEFVQSELKVFQKELVKIARKLKKAGFDDNFKVSINMPFDDLIAKQILSDNIRLGDIIKKRGKVVDIPITLEGRQVHLIDTPGVVSVGDKMERLKEGPIRELGKWVAEHFDDVAVNEIMAGLPLRYTTNYYARILSNELKVKMDDFMMKFFESRKGMLPWWNKHFKGRNFTDLSTTEIDGLFKDLQNKFKLKRSEVITFGKSGRSKFMEALAQESPEAYEFFITDPIRAVTLRRIASAKSITKFRASQEIIDKLAIWSGTRKELSVLGNQDTILQNLKNTVTEGRDTLAQLEARIVDGITDVEKTIIDRNIIKTKKRLERDTLKMMENIDQLGTKAGFSHIDLQGYDPIRGNVMIDAASARELIKKDLLKQDDLLGDAGAGLFAVPVSKIPDGVKIHLFPPEVGELINKWHKLAGSGEEVAPLLKTFDNVQNIWKQYTLFPIPKFHIRNFVSNVYLGWLGNVDPRVYQDGIEIMQQMKRWTNGKVTQEEMLEWLSTTTFSNGRETVTAGDMWGAWIHEGGAAGGLHRNEFQAGGVSIDAVTRKSTELGFAPASELVATNLLLDNKLLAGARNLSSAQENFFRLGAFIDGWKKGASFEEAGINMKKIFYEYSDLNAFERNFMRRVIPFYSWARHNIPRMFSTLATEPVKHIRLAQMIREIEKGAGGPAREGELGDWLSKRFNVVLSRNPDGTLDVISGDGLLPVADVYRILSVAGAVDTLKEGITPFLKYPVEQIFNHSFFTNRAIERAPGEPARSFTLGSLKFTRRATTAGPLGVLNILLNESLVRNVRVFSELSKIIDREIFGERNLRGEDPTFSARLLDLLLARVYTIDPARTIMWENIRMNKSLGQARGFIKQGLRENNQTLLDFGRSRLTQLQMVNEGDK